MKTPGSTWRPGDTWRVLEDDEVIERIIQAKTRIPDCAARLAQLDADEPGWKWDLTLKQKITRLESTQLKSVGDIIADLREMMDGW